MRIHSDVLLESDLHKALRETGLAGEEVYLDTMQHGSRKRARAFEARMDANEGRDRFGRKRRRTNSGGQGAGAYTAATWDEWGIWLARLFELDPEMSATYYDGRDDFMSKTLKWQPKDATAPWHEVAPVG